jgi:uncharacterized surface protein with fasciclin (FAS1) repeats
MKKEICMRDIMETIKNDATLQKISSSLEKAGLAELLKGAGPFTLFAPNDEAFARMNIEESLQDPENLSATLRYHCVAGKYSAASISAMDSLDTEYGKSLTMNLEEGETLVDNAKFVTTDIECTNGLVHVIDNVFKPQLSGWYREE